MNLVSINFKSSDNFRQNLTTLEDLIVKSPKCSVVLASELCLTGYITKDIDLSALNFQAIEKLKSLSYEKLICLTMTIEEENKKYNRFLAFLDGKIIYSQDKVKLFEMNKEHYYFQAGNQQDIKIFDAFGLKIGVLICFELRFINLWEQLRGADLILIPAMWGKIRKSHLDILSNSLAIANQCFVIVSDSFGDEFTQINNIISPFGNKLENLENLNIQKVDLNEIKKMRRYLPVGI